MISRYAKRKMFSRTEICEIMGVDESDVISMVDSGVLPKPTKGKSSLMFDRESLKRFLGYDIITKKEDKGVSVSFRIKSKLVSWLEREAKIKGVSRSSMLSLILEDLVEGEK